MDITYYYNDWIAIGNIIKNMFDEEGRALFPKTQFLHQSRNMMQETIGLQTMEKFLTMACIIRER